jgi:cytochrome c-type biogenesis protein CcmH/NrfG
VAALHADHDEAAASWAAMLASLSAKIRDVSL